MALHFLAPEIIDHQRTGRLPARIANRDLNLAPQGAYPCAGDDQWCTITVPDDEAWTAFVSAIGSPEWATDPSYATAAGRLAAHDEIDERIAEWTTQRSADDAEATLLAAGVPAGKVQRSGDLRSDPQYVHRDFYRRLEHSEVGVVPYAGHQYRFRDYDNGPRFAAPGLGEHTYEVLTELLGMDADEIAEIAAAGALE